MEVSFLEDEDQVILETYSPFERVTMLISSNPLSPYFYFYLHFIKDTWVIFPLSPFSMDLFMVLNIVLSQFL